MCASCSACKTPKNWEEKPQPNESIDDGYINCVFVYLQWSSTALEFNFSPNYRFFTEIFAWQKMRTRKERKHNWWQYMPTMNDHSFLRHRHSHTLQSVFGFVTVDFVTWLIVGAHTRKKIRLMCFLIVSSTSLTSSLSSEVTQCCAQTMLRIDYFITHFSLRHAFTTMWAKFNLISADHFLCLLSFRFPALISFHFTSSQNT